MDSMKDNLIKINTMPKKCIKTYGFKLAVELIL